MNQSRHVHDGALYRLYHTPAGRFLLKLLTAPPLSRCAGAFLDTSASARLIAPFVARAGIDPTEYEQGPFRSFNDFFTAVWLRAPVRSTLIPAA